MIAKEKNEIAEKINENFGGRVWCPDTDKDAAPVRIYGPRKGYIVIADDGHANIDAVGRADFEEAISACRKAQIEARRW